jgi:polysaccharide export outer membrane protein
MPAQTGARIKLRVAMARAFGPWIVALVALACAGQAVAEDARYTLDAGDKITIVIFGQTDLSGVFLLSSTGTVSMPLIGEVNAQGLTLRQLEAAIANKLKPDFLKNPQVSAEVVNYRPFYIIGEVKRPGTYPYVSGMRVVNAIAIAGGFSYRAKKKEMLITRAKGNGKPERVGPETRVLPGDVVAILERFF